MSFYVLGFEDIDKTNLIAVGGKGANLGELSRIKGIRVPDGFFISTEAYQRIVGETSSINELLDQLSILKVEDRDKIGKLSGKIPTQRMISLIRNFIGYREYPKYGMVSRYFVYKWNRRLYRNPNKSDYS